MKKLFFQLFLLMAVQHLSSIQSFGQWTVVNTGFSDNFMSISLADNNRLVAGGTGGNIFLSDDGGETWTPSMLHSYSSHIPQVAMKGELGYAVDANGIIFKSTDNGENWFEITNTFSHLRCVSIFDESRVFFGGQSEMLHEHKNGLWSVIPYIVGNHWLRQIYFQDEMNGFVVGDGGRAYKTPNNAYGWYLMNMRTTMNLTGIYFPTADTGYCSGFGSTLLKTVDGGVVWESVYSGPSIDFWQVYFFTNDYGYVSGSEGQILMTSDGGQTWIPEETNCDVPLRGFCYIPELDRLLVGGWYGKVLYKDIATSANDQQSGVFKSVSIQAYPNPFDGFVSLEISGLHSSDNRLIVLNAINQEVKGFDGVQNGKLLIDLTGSPSGTYYYNLISKGQSLASGKLIKF